MISGFRDKQYIAVFYTRTSGLDSVIKYLEVYTLLSK